MIGNSNDEDFNYLLDMLASIYLPSELVEKIYWIYGTGGKGKSDFIRTIIMSLVGSSNVSNVKIDYFDERKNNKEFRLGDLAGKRVNIDDDYSGQKIVNTGTIKQVVSGKNDFQADIKGEKPITFKVDAKLIINTNKKPTFPNYDSGDLRRNVIYPYKADFDKWAKENGKPYDFTFLKDTKEMERLASFLVNRAILMSEDRKLEEHKRKYLIKTSNIKKAEAYLSTGVDLMKKYLKSSSFNNEDRFNIFIQDKDNGWFISTPHLTETFNNFLNKVEDKEAVTVQKVNNIVKEMNLIEENHEKIRKVFSIPTNIVDDRTGEVKVISKRLWVYRVHPDLVKQLNKVKEVK